MGMFDTIMVKTRCPICGEMVGEFQCKDGKQILENLHIGDFMSDQLRYIWAYTSHAHTIVPKKSKNVVGDTVYFRPDSIWINLKIFLDDDGKITNRAILYTEPLERTDYTLDMGKNPIDTEDEFIKEHNEKVKAKIDAMTRIPDGSSVDISNYEVPSPSSLEDWANIDPDLDFKNALYIMNQFNPDLAKETIEKYKNNEDLALALFSLMWD